MQRELRAWGANIDIQPVFNHHKAVTYMCAYFSKVENETSEAMKQTARKALISGKSDFAKMKAIAKAYTSKREYSVHKSSILINATAMVTKNVSKSYFSE